MSLEACEVMESKTPQHSSPSEEVENRRLANSMAIIRVYNYYRVLLSFALLLLFLQVPHQKLVGTEYPDVFQTVILGYIGFNILCSLLALILNEKIVTRFEVVFGTLAIDVLLLCLLMYSSGGIESGLGNFLMFPAAFAGVLLLGKSSAVVPAIAVLLAFYGESNFMARQGDLDEEVMFLVGLLGIVLFSINLFFQYLAIQLCRRETEITTLENLNEMRNIAEKTRRKLEDSNAKFELLLNSAGEGVLGVSLDGTITFANPKASEMLKMPVESLCGVNIRRFVRADDDSVGLKSSFQASDVLHQLEVEAQTQATSWVDSGDRAIVVSYTCEAIPGSDGNPSGAVVVFQDVTERQRMEEKMNYLANYDSLTGLVNRGFYQVTIEQAISRCKRNSENLAVLLLDLDHFKCINDQYGHDVGDGLLVEVARRMKGCVRTGDVVARLGGDEFAVVLFGFGQAENLSIVAQNLVDQVSKPYNISNHALRISTSIGIATLEGKDMLSGELLKSADLALYSAKADGRNTYRFFALEMEEEAKVNQRIQVALKNAVDQNEFKLLYQPIFSLEDLSVHHSEALIRWEPRDEDPISPDVFIPIAEETHQIKDVTDWVLRRAIEQLETWRNHYGRCPRIAINVSSRLLASDEFRKKLCQYLECYDIPVDAIELELTETGVMSDPDTVFSELVTLHKYGFKIAIDDFGTGYSSLDYLRRLPIDLVKIDKCFVQGIGVDRADEEIIRVIIAVARSMQLKVVAEGIETEEQLKFLKDLNCDLGQGYLFSRPVDALTVSEVLFPESRDDKVAYLADRQPLASSML